MNFKELANLIGVILIIQFIAVLSLLAKAYFDVEAFVFTFMYGFLFVVLFLLSFSVTIRAIKMIKPLLNGNDAVNPFANTTNNKPNPLDKEFSNLKNDLRNATRKPKS